MSKPVITKTKYFRHKRITIVVYRKNHTATINKGYVIKDDKFVLWILTQYCDNFSNLYVAK